MKQTPDKSVVAQIRMTEDCTGCAACANICPVGAIKMEPYGQEGFYKPYVDPQVCINCGLCTKTCPQHEFRDKNQEEPACYAAMAADDIRLKSSSGGVFTLLAEEILRRGGVVCGVAFDEDWLAHHILVEDEVGLEKLRGSKYMQSFVSEDIFKRIQSYLEAGRTVMFTGVPCQVAGLYNFLRKDYENLYTVDLVCAYAPSPKVWAQYLNENYALSDIHHISFRDKTTRGWSCSHNTITTTSDVMEEDKYMAPYLNRLFKGEHCVNCKFKRLPRPADLTIGDFWRIQNHAKEMDDRKGTSGILVHNEKGKKLLKEIELRFKKLKSMELKSFAWQITVLPHIIPRTPGCRNFFRNIDVKPYGQNASEAPREVRVGIINWWFINNRGAILTNYALNKLVKELGYDALTINYITPFERDSFQHRGYVRAFTEKYIARTRYCENYEALKALNDNVRTFICGSDQIFNFNPCRSHNYLYYMGWVDSQRNKLISYAASFASNQFNANSFQKKLVRYWMKRFDFHSIREREGVKIMKEVFGINSEFVLDPVFCIDKSYYEKIAEGSTKKIKEDFIVYYYTVPSRCEHPELIDHVMKKTGAKKAIDLFNWDLSMEDWLWYLIHAKYVITNSFHGVCFSLLFNKPYACFIVDPAWDTRFSPLVEMSDHANRVFKNWREILQKDELFDPVNFEAFNSHLPQYVSRSRDFLKNAIEAPKASNYDEMNDVVDALINRLDEVQFALNVRCFKIEEMVRSLKK